MHPSGIVVQLNFISLFRFLMILTLGIFSLKGEPTFAGSDFADIFGELRRNEISPALVNYFSRFSSYGVLRQADDLTQFSSYLLAYADKGELQQRINRLRRYNEHLPHSLRWFLASAELSLGLRSSTTFIDAKTALQHLSFLQGISFMSRTNYLLGEVRLSENSSLQVQGFNTSLRTPERVIHLFVNLHKAWDGEQESAPKEIEKLRLDLYRMLLWYNAPFESQISTIHYFMKEMHDSPSAPSFQFHDQNLRHEAFRYIQMLAREIGSTHDRLGGRLGVKATETYKAILRISRKVLGTDIEYVLKNYTSLKFARLISLTEIINHKVTKEAVGLLGTLLQERNLSTDHFVIGTTLGLWQDPQAIRVDGLATATDLSVRTVLKGEPEQNFVRLKISGKAAENILWEEYVPLVAALFDGIERNTSIHSDLQETAKFMLKTPTPALSKLQGTELELWKRIELKRIQTAKRVLPEPDFMSALVDTVMDLDQHWRFQGVASAYFLSEVLNPEQRRLVSTQVIQLALRKRKAQQVDPEKSQQDWATYAAAWEQGDAALLYVIKYLDPKNPALILYLSKCVTMARVEGPLGNRRCLAELTELGVGSEDLRKYLRGQLQRLGHGDPVSDFRTYLRIFPTDSLAITEALGAYRTGIESPWAQVRESLTEVFKKMILVLVDENSRNPEIIRSIQSNTQIPSGDRLMIESIVKRLIEKRSPQVPAPNCTVIVNSEPGVVP